MVEVGDIYECLLEDGGDGRRFRDPLEYDAVFRSIAGALRYVQVCKFKNPVIHRLVYIEEGKYDFHVYDKDILADFIVK